MDRRVKERLVGASILLLLIVLIVPELLSGPAPAPATSRLPASPPEPVRSVTLDLKTSKAQNMSPALDAAAAAGPAASSAEPSAGVSSAGVSSAGEPSTGAGANPSPETHTAAPVENAPPRPTSVATSGKPANSGHAWAVQLGSFASHQNADKLARKLKAQGFAVYVAPGGSGASLRYRVRVGPMADRDAATQTAAKLKSLGEVASLVPPAP
jgi:DedD protein